MRRTRALRTTKRTEPTIALINVVFLMLVFFLVAGTLANPLDRDLKLVAADDALGRAPPDALVVFADGRLNFRGHTTTPETYVAQIAEEIGNPEEKVAIRIVPDRELPATAFVDLMAQLRGAGADKILVVTERGLE